MSVTRASDREAGWLRDVLHRESLSLGTEIESRADRSLGLAGYR